MSYVFVGSKDYRGATQYQHGALMYWMFTGHHPMSVEYAVSFQVGCAGVSWVLALVRTIPKMSPTFAVRIGKSDGGVVFLV